MFLYFRLGLTQVQSASVFGKTQTESVKYLQCSSQKDHHESKFDGSQSTPGYRTKGTGSSRGTWSSCLDLVSIICNEYIKYRLHASLYKSQLTPSRILSSLD